MSAHLVPDVSHGFELTRALVEKNTWIITVVEFVPFLVGTYAWFARRLRKKESEIAVLTAEKDGLRIDYDQVHTPLETTRKEYGNVQNQLASQVLQHARDETRDHNYEPAHRAVKTWLDSQGESISQILVWQSKWVIAQRRNCARTAW